MADETDNCAQMIEWQIGNCAQTIGWQPDWMACSMWSRSPSFSPLVHARKHTFQRYNSTVPKIVHYEARPIAHVDIILISS